MTISSTTRSAGPYTGTGFNVVFPFTFKVFAAADLFVVRTVSGVDTTLIYGLDYSVSLSPNQDTNPGGSIITFLPLAVGTLLRIQSNVIALQPLDLTPAGGFFPQNIEDALDRLTILVQQLNGVGLTQYLRVPELAGVPALPAAIARVNTTLGFDGSGNPVTLPISTGTAADVLLQLADTSNVAKNDALVAALLTATGAQPTTQHQINEDSVLNVFRFFTAAQIADVQARTQTIDVSAIVNVAVAAALLRGCALFFPRGTYRIDSPLLVYTAGTYITLKMYGELGSMLPSGGTVIDHSRILTAPGLCVQGARKVIIEHMSFWGPCTSFDSIANFFSASEWVQGGVRDSQYSPQCAIAVDPFKNGVPADGGYPTLTAYYTASALASSQVDVMHCYFRHQIGGVVYSPTGLAANDENGYCENCDFSAVKVPIALGQLQSKGMSFNGIYADLAYTVIDTYSYGGRNGSAGFQWIGGDVSRSCAVIRTVSQVGAASSITQNWSIRGCYFESIWTIGWIGTASTFNQLPGHFDACTFWFNGNDAAPMKDAHLVNFSPLKFTSCLFHANHSVVLPSITRMLKMYHGIPSVVQRPEMVFECCMFQGVEGILFNTSGLRNVRMKSCVSYSPYFSYSFDESYKVLSMNDLTGDQGVWPGAFVLDNTTGDVLQLAQGMNTYSLGAITVTLTGGASTATFTAPDANTFKTPGTGSGDVVYVASHNIEAIDGTLIAAANWPLGFCTSVVGTAITLASVSQNAPSGSQTLSLNWYPKMHGPTTVSTTNTLTAFTITQTGAAGAWQVGQRIISANIPGGAYIASGTSPNFVLSKAATATAAGTRAYDANANTLTHTAY